MPEIEEEERGTTHEPVLAGYQGQPGSFGARAAARCGRPVAFPTFERMLRALLAGEIACAVLPAVNRVEGPILESLDALARSLAQPESRVTVGAEIEVPVRLVLAAPPGLALEDVREVHSQAAALRQCRDLLARLDAIPIETHDTAYAAFRVKEAGGARAAVCSEEAALEAGLLILEEDVSDVRPNATRFWRLDRAAEPESLAPRVVFYAGVRASSALAEAEAELLSLPGTPGDPVRGFAVVQIGRAVQQEC
jgi:Prephenate dehydratase